MSNFIVEILDQGANTIEIETSLITNDNNIEIQNYTAYIIDIINVDKVLASDILDDIPVTKIDGLDNYLDYYEFDCGTP
jgi:hypothetical protein